MGSIIQTVQYQNILDHLFAAERYWYAALPGIFDELAEGIVEAKKQNPKLDIELVIDPTESAFRSHHGSIDAIQKLTGSGISIKQIPNHRLGFIMSEDSGWMLFTQSRAIEKDPSGPNAIRMNDMTRQELLYAFFEKDGEPEIIITTENIPSGYSTENEVKPEPLDDEAFDEVMDEIEQNPPPSPDFKRIFEVYTTKIKFVEFKVKGIKLDQRTITIPNDILNISDDNLRDRIKTRLNMFEDDERERIHAKFAKIEFECERIRGELLKRVKSRDKSALNASNLRKYKDSIKAIEKMYEEVKSEIEEEIMVAHISLEERIENELKNTYREVPPGHLKDKSESEHYERHIENYARKQVGKINIPPAYRMISGFEIISRIFDPTYEDFSDQAFIEELEEIGFISKAERKEIVDEFEAIGTQKDEKG